ncbi:MAG: hypothetical protein MHPSP_003939 [Paramarteilia canceri]
MIYLLSDLKVAKNRADHLWVGDLNIRAFQAISILVNPGKSIRKAVSQSGGLMDYNLTQCPLINNDHLKQIELFIK